MKKQIRTLLKKFVCVMLCSGIFVGNLPALLYEVRAEEPIDTVSINNAIINGSFETPVLSNSSTYLMYDMSQVSGWSTTATDQKIEFYKANRLYLKDGSELKPDEGKQGAELNANQESTLYQNLRTQGDSIYEWGLSHRGRYGLDTMALIIGPQQQYDAVKPTRTGRDQFMQMVDWVKAHASSLTDAYQANTEGVGQKITVYSRPFDQKGTFQGGTSDNFSLRQSDIYSQEWNVWIIASNYGAWHKCGYNYYSQNADEPKTFRANELDYRYSVPKKQTRTTVAFVSVSRLGTASDSIGNLLDNIQLRLFQPVTARATVGGTADVMIPHDNDETAGTTTYQVTQQQPVSTTSVNDVDLTLQAAAEEGYEFLGAYMNDVFYGKEQFTQQASNKYSYQYPLTGPTAIRFVFTKKSTVAYETNGGSWGEGENDASFTTSDSQFTVDEGSKTYTRDEKKLPAYANADFSGWWLVSYTAEKLLVPKKHTIIYKAPQEGEDTQGTFTVTYDDREENTKSVEVEDTAGLKFIAQWTYRQSIIPETLEQGRYVQDTTGGNVEFITPEQNSAGVSPIGGKNGAYVYSAQNNETVSVNAKPAAGYYFEGWYEGEQLYSTSQQISYSVGTAGKELTARFRESPYYRIIHYRLDSSGAVVASEGALIQGGVGDPVAAVAKTYEGYTYRKGYDKNGKKEVLSGTLTEECTESQPLQLKLYYTADHDSLKYDANFTGADRTMASTTGYTFEYVIVSANSFVRDGYTFTGWNTAKDGRGTSYLPNAAYKLTAKDDVLYAQWAAKACKLKFDGNLTGSTVRDSAGNVMSEKPVIYDTRYGTLPTAESDSGYTFAGWYTLPVGGDIVNSETKYTSLGESVTVYAHWTKTITIGDHVKVIHSYLPEGQTAYQTPESKPESITLYLYRKQKGADDSEYTCIREQVVDIQGTKTVKDKAGKNIVVSEADYLFTVTDSSSDYEYRVGTRLDNYDIVKPKNTGSDYPYKGITDSTDDIDFELQFNPNIFPADWKVEYVTSGENAVPADK
ncbi:MAG: InlB B-repeat-containing protein, partial [bacterium]|nr:InlB B-repeat-containing protein [bacterium]